jgi:hypothetical protein
VDLVREPVLYSLVRRHGLEPVVYRASVAHQAGWLGLSLAGDDKKIEEAILDLQCRGALVREGDRALMDSIEDQEPGSFVRVRLTIPKQLIGAPFYGRIIRDYGVVINIRQARITKDHGTVEMEISGQLADIDSAMEALKKLGARVDPIERNVIE